MSAADSPAPKTNFARVALLGAGIAAVWVVAYFVISSQKPAADEPDAAATLRPYLLEQAKFAKLDPKYADADGDLVADAPADAAKQFDPPELVFATVPSDDPAEMTKLWQPLLDLVAEKTGKKVTFLADPPAAPPAAGEEESAGPAPPGRSLDDHLELLRDGKLHVAAFSTGQVPRAVNSAGFVPLACPADAAGNFSYQMKLIAPAGSAANGPADLRGATVGFVSLSSNSGAKAPLVLLKSAGLMPGRDYRYTITGRHESSVFAVCVGQDAAATLANPKATPEQKAAAAKNPGAKLAAAAVADDILARMVDAGAVKADQFKVLATSDKFPPICFGIPSALAPKLRAGVEEAFKEFAFAGTPAEARFQALGRTKFAAVKYKDDWKDVREVDERLSGLVN